MNFREYFRSTYGELWFYSSNFCSGIQHYDDFIDSVLPKDLEQVQIDEASMPASIVNTMYMMEMAAAEKTTGHTHRKDRNHGVNRVLIYSR